MTLKPRLTLPLLPYTTTTMTETSTRRLIGYIVPTNNQRQPLLSLRVPTQSGRSNLGGTAISSQSLPINRRQTAGSRYSAKSSLSGGIDLAGSFQPYAIEALLQEVVTDRFGDFTRGRPFDAEVIQSREFLHFEGWEHRR